MLYPSKEQDIVRLARDVAKGLRANPEVFPAPPYSADQLDGAVDQYEVDREGSVALQARAVQGTAKKDKSLEGVDGITKAIIRYGESMTQQEPGKLELIAWGPRRPRSPNDLPIPGQVLTLEVLQEGSNWVSLAWLEPTDGGAVSAYRIQRRKRDAGEWMDVGMAVDSKATLNGQEGGVEWEYRVVAVNRSGEGPVSNVVRAVL